jgi:uncharacterized protein
MQYTALILGLAGSLHCIGMCSPLAMAVTNLNRDAWINRLLYNSGRILTYSTMGAVVGLSGFVLPFSGFQNLTSILLGILLLVTGIAGLGKFRIPFFTEAIQNLSLFLKHSFSEFLQHKNRSALVLMGSINGLLPCGLTYLALTICLTLKGPLDGFNFMLLFGVGTLPAMLGFSSVVKPLIKKLQLNLSHVTTGLMILSGCLLIARVFLNHPLDPAHGQGIMEIVLCR